MAVHVAILKRRFIRAILTGRKTVECRLSRRTAPPFGRVETGDRLFLKQSGGPFVATAVAGEVSTFRDLQPRKVDELKTRFEPNVCGGPDYWHAKRTSRFATFIHLRQVEPCQIGPAYKKSPYRGWFVLPDHAAPLAETSLTPGALRNGYLLIPRIWHPIPGSLELRLPDGACVNTTLATGRRLRWRGWRRYYAANHLRPGDRVRFLAVEPRVCELSFQQKGAHDRTAVATGSPDGLPPRVRGPRPHRTRPPRRPRPG